LAFSASGTGLAVYYGQGSIYNQLPEIPMNTLSTKLSAFAAALAINGLVMSAVGYLFALQSEPHMTALAFVHKVAAHQWLS
jgi:hypothetical protein